MALIDHLDFAKAFRRINEDRHDDAWPDIVGYRDYKRNLEENMLLIRGNILTPNRYQIGLPLTIDLPKRGFTLRPGVVPLIDDRMAY